MRAGDLLRAIRKGRWAVVLLLLGVLYLSVGRRYGFLVLEGDSVRAMEPYLHRGGRHLVDRDPPQRLLRGWIVAWSLEGALYFARVRAVPGDRILRAEGRWWVETKDRGRLSIPPGFELPGAWDGEVVPEGRYLLLHENRSPDVPDSRTEGWIPRSRIVARIVFALGGEGGT